MSARARNVSAVRFPYDGLGDGIETDIDAYDEGFGEFTSGEPVYPSSIPKRKNPIRRIYLSLALIGASGWAVANLQSDWARFALASLLRAVDTVTALKQDGAAAGEKSAADNGNAPTASAEEPKTAVPEQPKPQDVTAAPVPETALALPPVTATTEPQSETQADDAPSETKGEPLPSPAIDPADPYQKRAAAAGLHPGLSRVLLAKLSPADYRNAKIAIESAIAKAPESGTFVWPQKAKPKLALFEVHFVAGAAPDCRRYVVKIAKDGWTTTARPMEKCGSPLPPHRT